MLLEPWGHRGAFADSGVICPQGTGRACQDFVMRHPLWSFLEWLKDYANVLVALATLVYVVLTYRMLKALRRESTRELRLRHLEDIKSQVVKPIHKWIESRAIPVLKGQGDLLGVGSTPIQRQNVELGEPAFEYRRELVLQISPQDLKRSHLFFHAKEMHFSKELARAENFLGDFEKLLSDCLTITKSWADAIAKATPLSRVSGTSGPQEGADPDFFAALYLKSLAGGREPEVRVNIPAPGGMEIFDNYSGTLIARGPTEVIRSLHHNAKKVANDGWQKSGLGQRFQDLLRVASVVSNYVGRLELTYDLKGDCEYVGGRNPGRINRLWNRSARRLEH